MISASIPNPVPGSGYFKRALPGHFWQMPKVQCHLVSHYREYCGDFVGPDLQVCAGPSRTALRAMESAVSERERADVDVGRRIGVLPHDKHSLLKMEISGI